MATVIEIRVEYGVTQNLGDYSNVRPSVSLVARLDGNDNPDKVTQVLMAQAQDYVHAEVDNALEQNGGEVVYHSGPLYVVKRSEARKCLIMAEAGDALPDERNWKEVDRWMNVSTLQYPRRMRLPAAQQVMNRAKVDYPDHTAVLWFGPDRSLDDLPPLPDPGPEPLWSQKGLEALLDRMRIDRDLWDELAALAHVTEDWLQTLWNAAPWPTSTAEFLRMIQAAELPETPVEEEPDDFETGDPFDEDHAYDDDDQKEA